MKGPGLLEMTEEQLSGLIDRIEQHRVEEKDYPLIADLIRSMAWISKELEEQSLTIRRLKKLFGCKTEKTSDLSNNESTNNSEENEEETSCGGDAKGGNEKKKKKGKSFSTKDYKAAIIINIAIQALKKGDRCPDCGSGNLYAIEPGKVLKITGQPWLQARIYEVEKMRCSTCGKVFTAKLPDDVAKAPKYDNAAKAIVCLLKYRGGFPFYRQEKLQAMLETPVSDTALWEMSRDVALCLTPIHEQLIEEAAKGDCLHNDDTKARILDLIKENKECKDDKMRKGIYTSAILSRLPTNEIALFFTGRQHAGENLNDVLDQRPDDMATPTQMCDASNNNKPKDHITDEANCLAHLRRKFYEIADIWPSYILPIIALHNDVFRHDRKGREEGLDERALFKMHQEKSAPVMKELKNHCNKLIDDKKTEPNSSLGKAIAYMNNHWEGFTLFLRKPGVPLDNNADERLMKRAVLNRKNGLFFKTEYGAQVGDILLSCIETCQLNKVNPYNYLLAVQTHQDTVKKNPCDWLPWNYEKSLPEPNRNHDAQGISPEMTVSSSSS